MCLDQQIGRNVEAYIDDCLHQNLGEGMRELIGFQGCTSQERSMSADSNTTLESDILG